MLCYIVRLLGFSYLHSTSFKSSFVDQSNKSTENVGECEDARMITDLLVSSRCT